MPSLWVFGLGNLSLIPFGQGCPTSWENIKRIEHLAAGFCELVQKADIESLKYLISPVKACLLINPNKFMSKTLIFRQVNGNFC